MQVHNIVWNAVSLVKINAVYEDLNISYKMNHNYIHKSF